jgi:type IV secretory pathway ATPase VirB11/archaellum biosynthesis ATPase
LATFLPRSDRIVIIEETARLQVDKPNVVRFEARACAERCASGDDSRLVESDPPARPDRIVVGEVRGEDAYDLLQALNTGCCISIDSPTRPFSRLDPRVPSVAERSSGGASRDLSWTGLLAGH